MMLQYYEIHQPKHLDTKKKVLMNMSFNAERKEISPIHRDVNLLAIIFSL